MPITRATPNVTTGLLPTAGGSVTGELILTSPIEIKQTPTISAGALTLNLATGTLFSVNLNAAISTFTFQNPPASPKVFSFTLQFVADGVQRTVAWPAAVKWSYGSAPVLTSTLNKIDTFTFLTHDGGTSWFGFVSGQNF